MQIDRYILKAGENLQTFEFTSEGVKGSIAKLILFTKTDYNNLFNLAFGDKNGTRENLDDIVVSNNGDSQKVLATGQTHYKFDSKK